MGEVVAFSRSGGVAQNRRTIQAIAEAMASRREQERRRREERGRIASAPKAERGGKAAPDIRGPTPEQMREAVFSVEPITDKRAGGTSVTIGTAYRRKPMIDTLLSQGILSPDEYKALKHYRHHAEVADRSPLRDSLMNLTRMSGPGIPPGVAVLNAIRVRDDCERAAGSVVDVLRAVAVDDVSLQQWAIARHGGVDRCYDKKDRKGEVVSRVCQIKPEPEALRRVTQEIVVAAQRVQAELDACPLDR